MAYLPESAAEDGAAATLMMTNSRAKHAAILVTVALLAACGSSASTEPAATGQVGGRTIVYGRVTGTDGAGLGNVRVLVRHHTAVCTARPNESESVLTGSDGRYRAVLTALTQIGCVSVKAQPITAGGLLADSSSAVRASFKQSDPLDSLAVNFTLRGGIQ